MTGQQFFRPTGKSVWRGKDLAQSKDWTVSLSALALDEIEREFPEVQSQDSPTQRVAGTNSTLFDPVVHLDRLYSLDNVFSVEELSEWMAKTERDAGQPVRWLCEVKIDGLALSMRYENGILSEDRRTCA